MFNISNVRKNEVVDKLKEIFSEHIGKGNPISSENLFVKVIGVNPEDLDFYDRAYKWNAIKRILGVLRKSGELFVVMGNTNHYVLDSTEELDAYKNRVDATIKGLHSMKEKAKSYISSEELKQLKKRSEEKKKKKEKKVLKIVNK